MDPAPEEAEGREGTSGSAENKGFTKEMHFASKNREGKKDQFNGELFRGRVVCYRISSHFFWLGLGWMGLFLFRFWWITFLLLSSAEPFNAGLVF